MGISGHAQVQLEYSIIEDRFLITSSARRNEAQVAIGQKKAVCDNRCYSARIMLVVFAGNPATTIISNDVVKDLRG